MSSTTGDYEVEKDLQLDKNLHSSKIRPNNALDRTESNISRALDAEANIDTLPPEESAVAITNERKDEPGPPPNGGFHAWLQVVGSFFLFFNCWFVFPLLFVLSVSVSISAYKDSF